MPDPIPFTWSHLLYRLFAANGDLLYVGRTNDLRERFHKHEQQQPWWGEVVRASIETCSSFESLCAAEKAAIIDEKPRYNKIYSTIWHIPMAELPEWLLASARVTAAADAMHQQDCLPRYVDLPGVNPDEPPCMGCAGMAADMLMAADQAVGHLDPTIQDAQRLMQAESERAISRAPSASIRGWS